MVDEDLSYLTSRIPMDEELASLFIIIPVADGTFNNGMSDVTLSSFTTSTHEVTKARQRTITGRGPVTGYPITAAMMTHHVPATATARR